MIDDKGAFYNGSESDNDDNDDENYNGNMEAVVRGFQIRIRKFEDSQILQETTCVGVSNLLKTGSSTGAFL